jgi:CreA protein
MEMMLSWYAVDDFEKSKKFYAEALGMKKIFEMPGWAEFSHAEGQIPVGLMQKPENYKGEGAIVAFKVENIEKSRAELSKHGVRFDDKVEEVQGMVRIATFQDPSGNRLQLVQVLPR